MSQKTVHVSNYFSGNNESVNIQEQSKLSPLFHRIKNGDNAIVKKLIVK